MSGRYPVLAVVVLTVATSCTQDHWHSRDVAVTFGYRPEVPSLPLLNPRLDVRPRVSPIVRDVMQGEPVPVAFTIVNTGRDPLILLRLESSQVAGALHSWSQPVYGRLVYDGEAGGYTFHPDAAIRSRDEFHSGFLFPGDERTLWVDLTFRDSGKVRQNFSLVYVRKTPGLLREDILIPQKDDMSPVVRYVRPASADIEEWRKVRSRFDSILFRSSGGEMVFSFGRQFEVRPVTFSPEQAVARAGFKPDHFAYSLWKKGWVLEKDGDVTLVTPSSLQRYDGTTLTVFKFIESCKGTYLPVRAVSLRLSEGSVPFHVWDEDVWVSVGDAFRGYGPTAEHGHRIAVPVDDAFGLIQGLKARGYRTFRTSVGDQTVLGLEPVKE